MITSWCRLVRCLHPLSCELGACLSLINWDLSAQYHALGLLYHLRKNDRLAVTKMLNKFTKSGLKSPFAYCMMIRIASKLLEETDGGYVCLTLAFLGVINIMQLLIM